MTTKNPTQTAEELRRQIRSHDHQYYVLDNPTVSDQEYDRLMTRLREIEDQHPETRDPDSPTQRVGGAVAAGSFDNVQHPEPMLSLANAMTQDEFTGWHDRAARGLGTGGFSMNAEPKIDGLAIRLVYQDGQLVQAVTRVDGATARTLPTTCGPSGTSRWS